MSTTSIILAIRAIAIEFARRIYVPVLIVFLIVAALLIVLIWWLVMMSAWWWLLAVPVLLLLILGAVALSLMGVLFRVLRRTSTKTQRKHVSEFVDSLQEVSEVIQTPKFYILYRLIKDIVKPSQQSYISSITSQAGSLKSRLQTVINAF